MWVKQGDQANPHDALFKVADEGANDQRNTCGCITQNTGYVVLHRHTAFAEVGGIWRHHVTEIRPFVINYYMAAIFTLKHRACLYKKQVVFPKRATRMAFNMI